MTAIREKTKVKPGGTVEIHNPAFPAGKEVEVIVLVPSASTAGCGEPGCFFEVVGNLKLEGPADWSGRLDDYLYHGKSPERQ